MIEEMRTIRTPLLATAACLLLCVDAHAQRRLDVCPTGCTYASIQNAIDASSDGDTIAVAAGTYHEFDITLQGKAITISGDTDSNGLPAVTIDSQGMGTNIMRFIGEGNDTIIEHLVFTGCSGEGVAAVTMFHADPIMINCTFIDNVNTGLGGGAYILNGTVEDCNENGLPDSCDIDSGSSSDVNLNDIPDECECLGDVTLDGTVDVTDMLTVIATWGTTGPLGDANLDGTIDIADLLFVLSTWGPCP